MARYSVWTSRRRLTLGEIAREASARSCALATLSLSFGAVKLVAVGLISITLSRPNCLRSQDNFSLATLYVGLVRRSICSRTDNRLLCFVAERDRETGGMHANCLVPTSAAQRLRVVMPLFIWRGVFRCSCGGGGARASRCLCLRLCRGPKHLPP